MDSKTYLINYIYSICKMLVGLIELTVIYGQ